MAETYKSTLHLTLPSAMLRSAPTELTLHAMGREYKIRAHSTDTLREHRQGSAALRAIPESNLVQVTHFAQEVELSANAVGLYYATQPASDKSAVMGDMVVTGIHIPYESRKIAHLRRSRENAAPRIPTALGQLGVTHDLLMSMNAAHHDLVHDSSLLLGPLQTAKTILFQHPEIASINPEIAADMLDLYIDEALEVHQDLWRYISEHPPSSREPWQINTVAKHVDGRDFEPPTELVDKDGQEIPWPKDAAGKRRVPQSELADGTVAAAKTALDYVLRKTKDEKRLHGIVWHRTQGIPATQDKRGASVPRPAPRSTSPADRDVVGSGGDAYKWTLANPGSSWGLRVSDDIGFDGDSKQITVRLTNKANRCLGAYVEFLNSKDETIAADNWRSRLPNNSDYEPNYKKRYVDFIRPTDCIFGIPLMSREVPIQFPFPDSAVKARILLGGMGLDPNDTDVTALGRNASAILNYAMPGTMIAFGVGLDSTSWYYSVFTNPTVLEVLLGVLSKDGGFWLEKMDVIYFLKKAAGGLITVLLSKGLIFIFKKIVARVAGQQVAQSAPIAGWVMRIMCLSSAAGMMISTTVAANNAPAVYSLQLSRAIDVRAIVTPDPAHGGDKAIWPGSFDHYSLTLTHQSGATQILGPFSGKENDSAPLDHTFPNVPAGRAENIQVTVNLYAKNEWLCGSWVSEWVAAVPSEGTTLTIRGNIIERLVPLSVDTAYEHHRVLKVEGGKRVWKKTSTAPTEVAPGSVTDQHKLTRLVNMTSNNFAYRIGYTWMASGQGLPLDKGTEKVNTEMFAFQVLSALADPEDGAKFPGRGFSVQPYIAFDQFGPEPLLVLELSVQAALDKPENTIPAGVRTAFQAAGRALPDNATKTIVKQTVEWTFGVPAAQSPLFVLRRRPNAIAVYPFPTPEFSVRNFYLDPRGAGDRRQHLRHVDLTSTSKEFDYTTGKSWGVFHQSNIDAVVVHPNGYVIGASYQGNKFEILKLGAAVSSDDQAPVAIPMSGAGRMEGLLGGPRAMTITADGRVLVLEQVNRRVQAFDTTGAPVQCFAGSLKFNLDSGFAAALDSGNVTSALAEALQRATKPDIAPRAYLSQESADDLDKGDVSSGVRRAFLQKGIELSAKCSVRAISAGSIWLLEDVENQIGFDIRDDGYELASRGTAVWSVEVQSKGNRWIVRDSTNVQTFRIQKATGKLEAHQLIATMALKDPEANLDYLDIACEPEGFIYILSSLRPGDQLSNYRLDLYNPDGTFLSRTPKVNAAKITVNHWRTLFTLNYQALIGPQGGTEPSVSQWEPSVPAGKAE